MSGFRFSSLLSVILLLLVLSFELVVGLPVISMLLFHHLFISSKIGAQWAGVTSFSLLLAALYGISPVATALIVLSGFLFLRFRSSGTVQSTSWNYVYMSIIQASSIGLVAGVVINLSTFVSFAVQVLCIFFFLRRVVFKRISQSFHWEEKVGSSQLHEKTI